MKNRLLILALCLPGWLPALASADTPDDEESPWRIGFAVGYGERSNPLVLSEDVPIIVDVDIAWFGERFFFDNGDFGYTFADGPTASLSAVARVNSDRLFFSRTNTRFVTLSQAGEPSIIEAIEVPDRDYAVEAGIELLADTPYGRLQVTAFHDVSGTHDGYELFASGSRGFRANRWLVEPSVSLTWRSRRQNDYYWGVREDEAGIFLPAYQVGSGLNVGARLLVSYQFDEHWSAVAVVQGTRLADTIVDSPIVADEAVFAHYAGFRYRF